MGCILWRPMHSKPYDAHVELQPPKGTIGSLWPWMCRMGSERSHWKGAPMSSVPLIRGPLTDAIAVTPSS
eukprot:5606263-Prymnesium_polylepis.1